MTQDPCHNDTIGLKACCVDSKLWLPKRGRHERCANDTGRSRRRFFCPDDRNYGDGGGMSKPSLKRVVWTRNTVLCVYNNEYLCGPRYEQLLIQVPSVAIVHARLSLHGAVKCLVRV